jgi:hypothetical protein
VFNILLRAIASTEEQSNNISLAMANSSNWSRFVSVYSIQGEPQASKAT